MRSRRWVMWTVVSSQLFLLGSVFAAGPTHRGGMMVPPPAPRIIIGKRDGLHAQMIKKFDKNGDGRLDEKEREAVKQASASDPKLNKKK